MSRTDSHPPRTVLMVAFHYPPCSGTSGVHRSLKFSRYLPTYGWTPVVLTASSRAYSQVSDDASGGSGRVPPAVTVARAFALDTARHLSLRGSYPRYLALPDRWWSWWPGAVTRGIALIRRYRPSVLWSTYPIATAHLIALTLHRLTGIPWVADFRDPMTEEGFPSAPATRRCYRWIEERTLRACRRAIFTAGSTRSMYLARYPSLEPHAARLIENGYDETDFTGIDEESTNASRSTDRRLTIVHGGMIYAEERDPRPLFRALRRLKESGTVTASSLRVVLRGPGSEERLRKLIRDHAIDDVVSVFGAVTHRESLEEGARADALLLLQGPSCNGQIPAKTYEYVRLGKPILALTPAEGDTAARLRESGGATIVDIQDEAAICRGLPGFLAAIRHGEHPLPDRAAVGQWSRQSQARALAGCLDEIYGPENA